MKIVEVVAAIWQNDEGAFFLAQRGSSQSLTGYWEFPGGKVEEGEDEKEALKRELKEELGINVEVGVLFMENRHPLKKNVELLLKAYWIVKAEKELVLIEHQNFAWVKAAELLNYQLSPADIPIAQSLKNHKL